MAAKDLPGLPFVARRRGAGAKIPPPQLAVARKLVSVGRMGWLISAGIVFAVLFIIWWPMRDYVRIRRKDCCGKGCGCLFPVDAKKVAAARAARPGEK